MLRISHLWYDLEGAVKRARQVIKVQPDSTGTERDNLPGPLCGALKVIPEMTDTQRDALNMCHNKFVGHGVLNAP